MYAPAQAEAARALLDTVLSNREIARRTGVSPGTIGRWRRGAGSMAERSQARPTLLRPLDEVAYSYLLGLYLGDGSIATVGGSAFIQFTLDRKYLGIARECAMAITICTGLPVGWYDHGPSRGSITVQANGKSWLNLFPQHGPGKKHERKIELVSWQEEITHEYTREFIRGLIHSDGSRCMNRFSVKLPSGRVGRYEYPRYFFTNYSEDIRRIFCEHCELLGIRWTQSNWKNISVSHRDSVALLDSFVGPKT